MQTLALIAAMRRVIAEDSHSGSRSAALSCGQGSPNLEHHGNLRGVE